MPVYKVVFLGLSITSSWGNGHATNYRALMGEMARRGWDVTFLERDVPWYAAHRDLPRPPYGRTHLYDSTLDLRTRFQNEVQAADVVVVGSYVPDGVEVGEWVCETARGIKVFYDIDTPVTLAKLERGDFEYLSPALIGQFALYLSFTGGPTLSRLEREFGSPAARAFHCLVDAGAYKRVETATLWDLGYLGTYSDDRQPVLERLMLSAARSASDMAFAVAGPQYPDTISWPPNVERIDHLPPAEHPRFYSAQRFTLNVTRDDMVRAGYSPSVRLFEAAACGVPVISDPWEGLDTFFVPGEEILIAHDADDTLRYLRDVAPAEAHAIGAAARVRVLAEHTAAARVDQFVQLVGEVGARVTTSGGGS